MYDIGTKVIVTGDGGGLPATVTGHDGDKYIITFKGNNKPSSGSWYENQLRVL